MFFFTIFNSLLCRILMCHWVVLTNIAIHHSGHENTQVTTPTHLIFKINRRKMSVITNESFKGFINLSKAQDITYLWITLIDTYIISRKSQKPFYFLTCLLVIMWQLQAYDWNWSYWDQTRVYKAIKWRQHPTEDNLKIIKVEYLSNH